MEPRIQYAQTADGVSIAYWTMGEGTPLVSMPPDPLSHLQLEWQVPEVRSWYQRLAEKRRLVRYDGRGSGLSERSVPNYSLDALMPDLEAVVDRLQVDSFALLGAVMVGPVAVTYAAQNPECVSHLILLNTAARGSDFVGSARDKALGRLMDADWELYTETLAHFTYGWSAGGAARAFAARMRETLTAEKLKLGYRALARMDATPLLPNVRCPTLVLRRRQLSFTSVDAARALASRIPDARLALLEGTSVVAWEGDSEAVASAIDEFLGEGEKAAIGAAPSGLVTILFTDMEGSTSLTQRLGDAKAQEVLRTHNTIVRDALKAYSGSEIKHTGDGIMASFATASTALECAIAIQRAFAQHSEAAAARPEPVEGRAEKIRVRIGLNAGEPVAEEEDLFGTAVQLAARICAHAEPGQILAPIVVREIAAGKGFLFSDRGDVALRGFEDPVWLFEVRWREG